METALAIIVTVIVAAAVIGLFSGAIEDESGGPFWDGFLMGALGTVLFCVALAVLVGLVLGLVAI